MKRALLILGICAMLLSGFGCAARKAPSGENYYAKAQEEFAKHEYRGAIEDYQHLIDQYPFSPYAEDAELKVGLGYYQLHNYAQAIGTLSDFVQMHPTSKELDLASYYLGMSYFSQIGRTDQDQSNTALALVQFQTIERRFPESNFGELAVLQIAICREVLARHEYLIGDFYFKRANFRAAESRMAELMAKYPDTPIAPEALYQLAVTLEKQGKKYSAAQAFAALKLHFPKTQFAAEADKELKKLNQPVDTEEDPLRMVLTESGFGEEQAQNNSDVTAHPANTQLASADKSSIYGLDGLPDLQRAVVPKGSEATRQQAKPGGPVTLTRIRLASSDPPLSVILDLSGPVLYDQHLESGTGYSKLVVHLKDTTLDKKVENHLVFDRSIFKDCDVSTDSNGTTITLNTAPVSRYAIVPLEEPARLLVTFTPEGTKAGGTTDSAFPEGPGAGGAADSAL
jgi:outer membrane protein assembly factor BamD